MKKLVGRSLLWSLLGMVSVAFIGPAPASAGSPNLNPIPMLDSAVAGSGATLYEMNENMKLKGKKLSHRKAVSQLMGVAAPGSPLCPAAVLQTGQICVVNAEGKDNINLATGLGKFSGTLAVVVHGDNDSDSPEYVVMTGKFSGDMDFSPAVLGGAPFGTVVGKMVIDGSGAKIPFTGTFRLPFNPCANATNPCTLYGPAMYLINETGTPVLVNTNEYALGYPTVRFEIKFQ